MHIDIYLKVSKWQLPFWGAACTADRSTSCTYCKSIACCLWQAVGAMHISKARQLEEWRQSGRQTIYVYRKVCEPTHLSSLSPTCRL